jgi:gliding motility-associated lipoprotein GldH
MKLRQTKHNLFVVILFTTTLISCDSKRLYEENQVIPNQVWNNNNKMVFGVNVTDTINPCNVYINVRNASDYPYSNLYLFLETRYPNGNYSKDTLECLLADETGKWLGDGSGDIWDNQILFKKNVTFKKAGKYYFSLEQAMRTPNLPQILDVGLRIEKAI